MENKENFTFYLVGKIFIFFSYFIQVRLNKKIKCFLKKEKNGRKNVMTKMFI